jgi:hypothetical protein
MVPSPVVREEWLLDAASAMTELIARPRVKLREYVYWQSEPIPRPGDYVKLITGDGLGRVETAHASSGTIEKRKRTVKIVAHAEASAGSCAEPRDGVR